MLILKSYYQITLLQHHKTDSQHPDSLQLLQKYIAYARTYVSPVLSDEAAEVLRSFYLQLRRQASLIDGAPVTVNPGIQEQCVLISSAALCSLLRTVPEGPYSTRSTTKIWLTPHQECPVHCWNSVVASLLVHVLSHLL